MHNQIMRVHSTNEAKVEILEYLGNGDRAIDRKQYRWERTLHATIRLLEQVKKSDEKSDEATKPRSDEGEDKEEVGVATELDGAIEGEERVDAGETKPTSEAK